MKPNFKRILKKNNSHSTLIDDESIINALEESYKLGLSQREGELELLKTTFKSLLSEYVVGTKPQQSKNIVIEEWEKRAGIF